MDQPYLCNVYEGYLLFKADPLPGQRMTWGRVERTRMHLTQADFYRMIYERAFEISAANQYQALPTELRVHVDKLIHERRRQDASVEWSCTYAEEHRRVTADRDALDRGPGIIAMTIILMRRPWAPRGYRRTPMGDLVDMSMPPCSNGREQDVKFATVPDFPAGHTHPHDLAMRNSYPSSRAQPAQERSGNERASMACLLQALSEHHQPRAMKRYGLPGR
jgi:hypothetical protein